MTREKVDTHQKASQINMDPNKYGTVAEIGAGQEVARWFFRGRRSSRDDRKIDVGL